MLVRIVANAGKDSNAGKDINAGKDSNVGKAIPNKFPVSHSKFFEKQRACALKKHTQKKLHITCDTEKSGDKGWE